MKSADLFDLTGKVALVTGARTGLGQAMALALAPLFPIGKTVVEVDELRLLPGAGTGLRV